MTQIAVYNRDERPAKPEVTVYLQLVQQTGYVLLKAVNERGTHANCGNLMKIYPDGTFILVDAGEINEQDFRNRF